jgi:perosamine synthetase
MQAMLDEGIATRRGIMCAHREPAYPSGTWSCAGRIRSRFCTEEVCRCLRHSEEAQDRTVILPLFPEMTFEQQDRVAESLQDALRAVTLNE